MRSDNDSEFVSHAILKWIAESNIQTALKDPGKPWQNGTDESFNGRLRDCELVIHRRTRSLQYQCPPTGCMTDKRRWPPYHRSHDATCPNARDDRPAR
jgi:transposase InsO family protein